MLQMPLGIETFRDAAVESFGDGILQVERAALVFFEQPQPGAYDLAGIVITPLGDLGFDEALEIVSSATDVVLIVPSLVQLQSYQYLVI